MKKSILLTVGLVLAFLIVHSSSSFAGLFDAKKSVEGIVMEIQSNLISLRPTAKAEEAMNVEKVSLTVNEDTKFKGVALTDLKKGDPLKVEYKEDNGAKVAIQVEKMDKAAGQSGYKG